MQNAQAVVNAAIEAAKNNDNSLHLRQGNVAGIAATASPTTPAMVAATLAPTAGAIAIKTEPGLPPPVNTAVSAVAGSQGPPSATQPQQPQIPRVQTPISAWVGRLSHSDALALANQRPAGAGQPSALDQSSGGGAATANGTSFMGAPPIHQQQPNQQQPPQQQAVQTHTQQQVPPAAQTSSTQPQQPPQPQPAVQISTQTLASSKPATSRHLPDKATAVPQPVSLGGGVAPGRPTLTGGGGTLGGAMGPTGNTEDASLCARG